MTEYFVDSRKGKNCGVGCVHLPYQTIAALPPFVSGDVLTLIKGSFWREQVSAVEGLTIISGGDPNDDLPTLCAADIIPNNQFVQSSDYPHVFTATVSPNLKSVKTTVNAWQSGNRYLAFVATLALCEATEGSYWVSSHTVAPILFAVHPYGSTNPILDGDLYEFSARLSGIYGEGVGNVTIDGIKAEKCLSDNGNFFLGGNCHVTNIESDYEGKHGVYMEVWDTCLLDGVKSPNSSHLGQPSTHVVFYDSTPDGHGYGVMRNLDLSETTNFNPASGGVIHHTSNPAYSLGHVLIENVTINNIVTPLSLRCSDGDILNNVVITNCPGGVTVADTPIPVEMNDCRFENTTYPLSRPFQTLLDGVSFKLKRCTFTLNGANGAAVYAYHDMTVDVEDCTFEIVNGSSATYRSVFGAAVGKTLTLKVRTSNFKGAWKRICDTVATATLHLDSDFNCFASVTLPNRIAGIIYATMAAYKAATGQDANSTIGGC